MQKINHILGTGLTFKYDNPIIQKFYWFICALSPLFLSIYHYKLRSLIFDVAVFFIYISTLINFVKNTI